MDVRAIPCILSAYNESLTNVADMSNHRQENDLLIKSLRSSRPTDSTPVFSTGMFSYGSCGF
jgi:hypothetical protein